MLLLPLLLATSPAAAHGIWGHVHVTGWAVENMPDDELRQFLLDDPEVFNALLFGAVFTDTGYALDDPAARAYSEHTHWEPFIEDFVQWIIENDPPPWDDLESRKRVAFLMGCASHGLQDSIFDSLFLAQVEQRDGAGQDETDPGTDGFLALDGHIRFIPEREIPLETVLELYDVLDEEVTAEVIDDAVTRVTSFYINGEGGLAVAAVLGEQYAPTMPWGRAHYLDPEVPGSLRAEIYPTMRYQQAIWRRLHGEYTAEELNSYAWPELPRRLRSGDLAAVDSWVTLLFGEGVSYDSVAMELLDDSGAPVAHTVGNTRWGADPTRLVRLLPAEALAPGGWYTVRLLAGVQTIGGRTTTAPWELRFQVECETADDPACPDLGEIPVASIDGVVEEAPAEDTGDAGGPAAADDDGGGCGCAATGRGGLWSGLLLAAVSLVVRRRRTM